MIHTRICDLLGIAHPIVLGGMGTATTAPLPSIIYCFKSRRICSRSLSALDRRSPGLRGHARIRICASTFSALTMPAAKLCIWLATFLGLARTATINWHI